MPSTPYADLYISVNGGDAQKGGLTVTYEDEVQLTPGSTVGWTTPATIYQITDYPDEWTAPAGWTLNEDTGHYEYYANGGNGIAPPAITMPDEAAATGGQWGKWLFRLLVNGGGGNLTDWTSGVKLPSPALGLNSVAKSEGVQWGGSAKGYVGELQEDLRAIEEQVVTLGAALTLGTGTPAKVSNSTGTAGSSTFAAPFDHAHQIDPASGSVAGSMSSAHYSLVNGATASNTASTIAKRTADGDCNYRNLGLFGVTVASGLPGGTGARFDSRVAYSPRDQGSVTGNVTPDGLTEDTGGSNLTMSAGGNLSFQVPTNFLDGSFLFITVINGGGTPTYSWDAVYVFPKEGISGTQIPSARLAAATFKDLYVFEKSGTDWICRSHNYTF